ncbi:MAG: GNAT family N-acetyltransferase [Chthoniobacterales bacterium]
MPNEPLVDLTIRAARTRDAAALAGLMCELGYQTAESDMQIRLNQMIPDSNYRTFVAVEQGRVLGMIGTFALYSFEHNDLGGRILALVVTKESRRSGVARRLIAAAEKDSAQRKITRIAVNTRFERNDAHAFYESLGYTRNGFRFVKNLKPAPD